MILLENVLLIITIVGVVIYLLMALVYYINNDTFTLDIKKVFKYTDRVHYFGVVLFLLSLGIAGFFISFIILWLIDFESNNVRLMEYMDKPIIVIGSILMISYIKKSILAIIESKAKTDLSIEKTRYMELERYVRTLEAIIADPKESLKREINNLNKEE